MRPINGAQAHRTGLAGGIQLAIKQLKNSERCACLTDGQHFRMSGGIVGGRDAVHVLGNYFALSYNDSTEWPTVVGVNVVNGKLNGPGHKWIVHINLPLGLPDLYGAVHSGGKIPRRRFSAASISPERRLFGSNYDLRGFEKLQMPSSHLP